MQEMRVGSLGQEDSTEEEMSTLSRILAWGIPWTEEPGGLQSRGRKELNMTGRLSTHACMQLVPERGFVRTKQALVNPAAVWLQEAKLSLISRCCSLKPITALTWCHAFHPAPANDWVMLRQGHSFERLFPSDGRPSSAWLMATQTFSELPWSVKLFPPTCLLFFDPSLSSDLDCCLKAFLASFYHSLFSLLGISPNTYPAHLVLSWHPFIFWKIQPTTPDMSEATP